MLLVVTAATDFKNVDAHQTKLYLLFFFKFVPIENKSFIPLGVPKNRKIH